jgi:hypothetical protein
MPPSAAQAAAAVTGVVPPGAEAPAGADALPGAEALVGDEALAGAEAPAGDEALVGDDAEEGDPAADDPFDDDPPHAVSARTRGTTRSAPQAAKGRFMICLRYVYVEDAAWDSFPVTRAPRFLCRWPKSKK